MWPFKRSRKIKLVANTFDKAVFDFAKPIHRPGTPNWLRNLCPVVRSKDPLTDLEVTVPTAAYCPGIKDYVKKGIIIPAWFDCEIIIRPNGSYDVSSLEFNEKVVQHPNYQMGSEFIKDDRIFLKLSSPWAFTCKEDIDFSYGPAFYNSNFYVDNDVINPPGILNFKYQTSTNIHLAFKIKPETYRVEIKAGTPLTCLIPLSEREVDLELKLVDNETFWNLSSFPKVKFGKYYKKLNLLKVKR